MTETSLINLETQVIGAILRNDHFYARATHLTEEAFSDRTNKLVWRLIEEMKLKNEPATPARISVIFHKEIDPVGGLAFLNRVAETGIAIETAFNEAVDRLHGEMQWQRIASIGNRLALAASSREKTPDQILTGILSVVNGYLAGGPAELRTKKSVARAALDHARQKRKTVTTGIDNLDFLMQGGLQRRRLYGLAAPFGRGKTIMLGSISDNLNIQAIPHLFFSLETPPEDIEIRSCAKHLNINASSIHDSGDDEHDVFVSRVDHYIDKVPDNTVYEFSPGASMDEIHRKILAAKARYGIEGFLIDYWQLIRGRERGQTEENHLRECADRLAAICRQEDLWGMVTAQVDERGRLRVSDSLIMSASLYIRLAREENESASFFITEKSNYTRLADTGSETVPTMVFDQHVGPHFRNTETHDIGDFNTEGDIKL